MEYKYTGIILNKWDIGETDRIYNIYTQESGKIKAIAKGVRKPHAKLASSLESLTLADVTIARNRGMGKITGSIVENIFPKLKKDGEALLLIFRAITLFNKLVDFENKDEDIFRLLNEYLESVDDISHNEYGNEKNQLLYFGFCIKLLDLLGYKIEATFCVINGCQLVGERFYFSSKHGGVVCDSCVSKEKNLLPISSDVIKIMRICFQNKLRSLTKLKVEKKELNVLNRIMSDFIIWIG